MLAFHNGSKCMIVELPEDLRDQQNFLQTAAKLPPEGQGMSRPRLRLACCQASSGNFRWSMSPEEVRWHIWCIAMAGILRCYPDGRAETLCRDDLEGIVLLSGNERYATFDWEVKGKNVGAYIHFKDDSGALDATWVHCVCESVRCSGESYPAEMSKQELPACQILSR